MNLQQVVAKLRVERGRIDQAIAAIESLNSTGGGEADRPALSALPNAVGAV